MIPLPILYGAGVGALTDPDAEAHIARCSSLTADEETALTSLVAGLKSDGLWSKLDQLIVPKGTQADSLLNIRSASYDATNVNACTFTASQGWTVEAAGSKYLNSNYTPGAGLSSENSTAAFMYRRTAAEVLGSYDLGASDGSNLGLYIKKQEAGFMRFAANYDAEAAKSDAISAGFYLVSRYNASQAYLINNAGSYALLSGMLAGSSHLVARPLFVGARNNGGTVDGISDANQYACFGAGAGLNLSEAGKLQNRIQAYMVAIGAAV